MFNYNEAFSRNLGWITKEEQQQLRGKRVAIAGMGGVGGSHLLTLTRLGIGGFALSDFDTFEQGNFNRQAGSSMSTVGKAKLDTMAKMALDINPELEIRSFDQGINQENVEDFLQGIDLYVDSLDFFALDARRSVFETCAKLGIPAVTAAPIGMGAAFLCFMPGSMSFENYFRFEGHSRRQQLIRFIVGLTPSMLQIKYLLDQSSANFDTEKGPSTPMGCTLCAGVAASNALKVLLNRGEVVKAPHGLHFDAYRNRLKKTWRPGGNSNPLQRIAIAVATRILAQG